MSTVEIDCRNLECPGPVMKTKAATEKTANTCIRVLVDNEAAIENVSRFLSLQNFQVSVDSRIDYSIVEGVRKDAPGNPSQSQKKTAPAPQEPGDNLRQTMLLVSSNRLGTGDDVLGEKLMLNLIKTLPEMGEELWKIAFVNSAVKLTIADSPALPFLNQLAESGVDLLVCGTCLSHFGLMESKAIGSVTNMMDIVTSMQIAKKVIPL